MLKRVESAIAGVHFLAYSPLGWRDLARPGPSIPAAHHPFSHSRPASAGREHENPREKLRRLGGSLSESFPQVQRALAYSCDEMCQQDILDSGNWGSAGYRIAGP